MRKDRKNSPSPRTSRQWSNVQVGVIWKKPARVMKLPQTRTNAGASVSSTMSAEIAANSTMFQRPKSISPGRNWPEMVV